MITPETWGLIVGVMTYPTIVVVGSGIRKLIEQHMESKAEHCNDPLAQREREAAEALYAVDPALAIELGYVPPERPVVQPTWRERDRAAYERQMKQYAGGLVQGSFQQNLAPGLSQMMGTQNQRPLYRAPKLCNCLQAGGHPCVGKPMCPYSNMIEGTRQ